METKQKFTAKDGKKAIELLQRMEGAYWAMNRGATDASWQVTKETLNTLREWWVYKQERN